MHYQQQQQQQLYHNFPQQQQHPLLAATGNNYAYNHPRGHYPAHANSYRPVVVGGSTSAHGGYYGSSASGYGASSGSGFDYHPAQAGAAALIPTGGSYGYQATAGTGYGAPLPPVAPTAAAKKKSGGSSALTALTLLSFFFFVNLLQGCIKDQMAAMNPTVMVMTAGVARNRFNKLAEMNSREQGASAAAAASANNMYSSGAAIVMKPVDLVASASALAVSTSPPVMLAASPYSQNAGNARPLTNYNYNNNNGANKHTSSNNNYNNNNYDSSPEFYDAKAYPNQTLDSVMSSDKRHHTPTSTEFEQQQQHAYNQHHQQQQQPQYATSTQREPYPWSYGSSSSSDFSTHRNRGSSSSHTAWSHTPNRIGGSKYFEDGDEDEAEDDLRRGDSYYTRIN